MDVKMMCTMISSDVVIGNFVIEAVKKNDYKIELNKLYNFDEELSKRLKQYDIYTKFTPEKILDFQENYPFFIESIENNSLRVATDADHSKEFLRLLIRYFRIGIPKLVVTKVEATSKDVLG